MIEARDGGVWAELSADEVDVLAVLPALLDGVGTDPTDPAGPRLNQSAYPDDPIASAEYEVSHAEALDGARTTDRTVFAETLDAAVAGVLLTEDQAAAWMRVTGDARLALAARLGIEDNRWQNRLSLNPQMRLVHYLTYIQGSVIEALDELIDAGE